MPILETANAVLPKNNQESPGETIYREVVYSGYSLDGQVFTEENIKEMFYDTKAYMLDKGSLVKVNITHFQDSTGDQELKGFVQSLELHERSKEEGGGLSIWSKMHLYPETYKSYKEGRYPEVSIYAMGKVSDRDGKKYKFVLDHIALLGATRALLPEAKPDIFASMIKKVTGLMDKVYSILPNKKQKEVKRAMEIKPEELEALLKMLEEATALVKGWVEPEDGEEPAEDGGQSADPDSERQASTPQVTPPANTPANPQDDGATAQQRSATVELEQQMVVLKKQSAEMEYDRMFSASQIKPDQKENFMSICIDKGAEFARSVYADHKIDTPPTGDQYSANSNVDAELKEARERLESQGLANSKIGLRMLEEIKNRNN